MDRFEVGTAVTLEIAYVDYNGAAVVPTSVTYSITDENDLPVGGPFAIAGPYTESATFTIPAQYNTPAGGRQIELKMTNASGDTYADAMYQVRDATKRLLLLVNTFQTHMQALLTANDMVNVPSWQAATEDQQIAAMTEAYYRLTRFGYLIKWPEYVDTQNIYLQDMHARITPQMWPVMTPTNFAPYPVQFQTALKKAQIVEADFVLTADPYGEKRRAGVLAESVGESKFMFKGGIRPLDMGLARQTLVVLKTYLDFRSTLTRAP